MVEYYSDYRKEWEDDPQNEYAVFSWIVKPYIEKLYEEGRVEELEEIWCAIEEIASEWGDPARNEILVVTAEEIELYKHYKYLGPTLLEHWIISITWYPEFTNKGSPINRHINKLAYRERWLEEIASIGGFGQLTASKEAEIYNKLCSEFKVKNRLYT